MNEGGREFRLDKEVLLVFFVEPFSLNLFLPSLLAIHVSFLPLFC